MESFVTLLILLKEIGVTLGVGASTFAIIFFVASRSDDGVTDKSEGRFMGIVYFVLRIAMVLLLLAFLGFWMMDGGLDPSSMMPLATFGLLLFVLYGNAILMTLHKVPMWLGPALQGGSWYTLGVLNAFPQIAKPYESFILVYIGIVVAILLILSYLKKRFTSKKTI